jgi:hypothetical protein
VRPSVRDAFVSFTAPLEGVVPHFYADVKGLVTIAIGNLVDPLAYALTLPMVDKVTGRVASRDDIARDWQRVKRDDTLAKLGHRAAAHVTSLKLTPDGISKVVLGKLDEVDRQLARRFPSYEAQPADGQLLVLSMSWAMGAGFRFPAFEAAFLRGDYRTCADECVISITGTAGIKARNVANRQLAMNAANVVESGGDYDRLWWPGVAANDRETVPQFPPSDSNESLEAEPLLADEANKGSLPVVEGDGGLSRRAMMSEALKR